MTDAQITIRPADLGVTLFDGLDLAFALTFLDDAGAPFNVDADTAVVMVGDVEASVTQADTNVLAVSASAEALAGLDWSQRWSLAVSGALWLEGSFRRTSRPGASTVAETVTVHTGDQVVAVSVDSAAVIAGLTAQIAALTLRLDAIETALTSHTFMTIGGD